MAEVIGYILLITVCSRPRSGRFNVGQIRPIGKPFLHIKILTKYYNEKLK